MVRNVERKIEEDVVMRTRKMEVGGHQKIGKPKLRWRDVIQNRIKETGVQREDTLENLENENLWC